VVRGIARRASTARNRSDGASMQQRVLKKPRVADSARRFASRTIVLWPAIVLAASTALGTGCETAISCVETATCAPNPADGGEDAATDRTSTGANDGSARDNASDSSLSDVPRSPETGDGTLDRRDESPSWDARLDNGTTRDASDRDTSDSSRSDAQDGTGKDVSDSVDANVPADINRDHEADNAQKDAGSETSPPNDTDAGSNDACTPNACGGCAVLAGIPGARCGSCGTYVCSADKNSVACDNDPGLNACGGCGTLSGVPGTACGSCGTYVCSPDKASVACDHPDYLKVTQLTAGGGFTCALLETGNIRCWGQNDDGQLGDGTVVGRVRPPSADVVANVSDFTAIAAGTSHVCALRKGGGLRCWGANLSGQLGNGTNNKALDAKGADVLAEATAVTAAGDLSCALLATGKERCWGFNGSGELGDGTSGTNRSTPTVDVVGLSGAVAISGSCALLNHGGMVCWGEGTGGALGDGLGTSSSVPVDVLHLNTISSISAGSLHTCALAMGGVHCWGSNVFGQCGDGRQARNTYEPPLSPAQLDATAVGTGSTHTCALLKSGHVRCWGENHSGEVGDGTNTERLTPVDVAGLSGVISLAVGSKHNCALLASGSIRCWGANSSGQLGDGSRADRWVPVDVPQMCP
jgi:alpha-tubulin suppressor-like RCC1 family protein